MLFTEFAFFILLTCSFVLFYAYQDSRSQVLVLIAASFIFYAFHTPVLLLLLLFTILSNWYSFKLTTQTNSIKRLRSIATIGVTLNLGVLALFKYAGFIGSFLLTEGDEVLAFLVAIPLPIGISFYTFQGISFMVDSYRTDVGLNPKRDYSGLKEITLFLSFFPQLVAGPIVKSKDFIPQIETKYLKDVEWEVVVKNLIMGYFLKSFVADNLKNFTFWMEYPYFQNKSGLDLIFMLFGYSAQIFADFAGYSLIAIGLARLFGYKLPQNFNYPYISTSFSEFWRRWHISLSSFLKDYLYIPMGGNKKGRTKTYFNLLITMILGGLWHGAAWSYVIWGTGHGLLLALERIFINLRFTIPKLLKWPLVFFAVSLLWLMFKLPEFEEVVLFLKTVWLNLYAPFDVDDIVSICIYSSPVFVLHLLSGLKERDLYPFKRIEYFGYSMMLFFIITNSGTSQPFIYFQF